MFYIQDKHVLIKRGKHDSLKILNIYLKSLLERNLINPWGENELVLEQFLYRLDTFYNLKEYVDIKRDMRGIHERVCRGMPSTGEHLSFKHINRK